MLKRLTTNSKLVIIALMAFTATPSFSGEITYQSDSYASGDTLTAAALNSNFNEAKTQVNDNNSRIVALEATIVNLQSIITSLQSTINSHSSDISTINNSNVMDLNPYITVNTVSDARGPLIQLRGINLQLINGGGNTTVVNGLGNLIVGYDPARADSTSFCSIGYANSELSCATAGGVWAVSHKSGSHNLVIGDENNYSSFGGMVVGYRNTINGRRASVSGGYDNTARADNTAILGGRSNIAGGEFVGLSDGIAASVSGGESNEATGDLSSVSGGRFNDASGASSSVSGGRFNDTSGFASSISGGSDNRASGSQSSILGGNSVTNGTTNGTSP